MQEILAWKARGELLEIGFGRGELLELAQEHLGVSGIEVSPYAVRQLQHRFGDRVRQGDIERETLPKDRYDVVVAFNVLEHLESPTKAIANIYNGLKEGGVLIGSVPNNSTPVGRVHTALTNLFDRTHCSTFAPRHWRALFAEAGFDRVTLYGEVMLGNWCCTYLHGAYWPYMSFNMIFACQRQSHSASRPLQSQGGEHSQKPTSYVSVAHQSASLPSVLGSLSYPQQGGTS
jgi:SAM-dependent methyltransferase